MALFLFEMEFLSIVAFFLKKFEMTFIDNREFERVSARISGAFWLKLCACDVLRSEIIGSRSDNYVTKAVHFF